MNFYNLEGQNVVEIEVWWHSQIKLIRKLTYKTKSFEPCDLDGQKDQVLTSPCGIQTNSLSRINLNVIQYTIIWCIFLTTRNTALQQKVKILNNAPEFVNLSIRCWSCPQDLLHALLHASIQNYMQMDAEINLCWKSFGAARIGDRLKLGKSGWLQWRSFPFPKGNLWLYLPVENNLLFYHWTCDWAKNNYWKGWQKINFRL